MSKATIMKLACISCVLVMFICHRAHAQQPDVIIEVEPVLHNGEICLSASWSTVGTRNITFYLLSRARFDADRELVDHEVLATAQSISITSPFTAPSVLDCPPGPVGQEFQYTAEVGFDAIPFLYVQKPQSVYRPIPPQAPTGFAYTPPTVLQPMGTLNWAALATGAASGYTDVTGYEVQFRVEADPEWRDAVPPHTGTQNSYTDDAVWKRGTLLHFRVRGTNIATELKPATPGAWGETQVTLTGDIPPQVTAEIGYEGCHTVNLNWSSGNAGVLGYHVYRRPTDAMNGSFTLLATGLTTSNYSDVIGESRAYDYRVQAYNIHGGGPQSAVIRAHINRPTNVTGTPGLLNNVISWAAPPTNQPPGIVGYRVEYATTLTPPPPRMGTPSEYQCPYNQIRSA